MKYLVIELVMELCLLIAVEGADGDVDFCVLLKRMITPKRKHDEVDESRGDEDQGQNSQ